METKPTLQSRVSASSCRGVAQDSLSAQAVLVQNCTSNVAQWRIVDTTLPSKAVSNAKTHLSLEKQVRLNLPGQLPVFADVPGITAGDPEEEYQGTSEDVRYFPSYVETRQF